MTSYNCWPFVTTHIDLWQLVTTCDNLWDLLTTFDNFWQLVITCDKLWQLVTTRDNCDNLWQYVKLERFTRYWTNCKFWKSVTDRQKTEDRRQKTDGVSDNASTREACASKNFYKRLKLWLMKWISFGLYNYFTSPCG